MRCVGNMVKHLKDPRDASTDTYMQQQRGENLFGPSRVTGFSELGSLRNTAKVFYINLFKSLTKRFLSSVSTCLRIKAENICGMYDFWVTVSSAAAAAANLLWSEHAASILLLWLLLTFSCDPLEFIWQFRVKCCDSWGDGLLRQIRGRVIDLMDKRSWGSVLCWRTLCRGQEEMGGEPPAVQIIGNMLTLLTHACIMHTLIHLFGHPL